MTNPIASLVCLLSILTLAACGFEVGPAHPERDGRAYLEAEGYSEEVISSVLSRLELDADIFEKLAKETSTDVRFLVAQNPFISQSLLSDFVTDKSDFVRGGAALNRNLTPAHIVKLSRDPSHTTRLYVARNPSVPEEHLLRLHSEQNVELIWFAMNPNCPEPLKQKMRDQNDKEALYWLEATSGK